MTVLCCAWLLSHVRLFSIPETVPCQTPLSMGFSRQEYWRLYQLQGIFPTQESRTGVSCIAGRFFTTEPPGIPLSNILHSPNTDREPQFTQRRNCPRQQQSGVSNLNCLAPGSVSLNTCPYLGPQLSLAPSLPACTSRQTLPSRLYCDPTEDAVHKAHASAACD